MRVVLKFSSQVRATKPAKTANLVERHIKSIEGRLVPVLRRVKDDLTDEQLMEEIKKWRDDQLNVFQRKQYNGIDQIAIPNSWIYGVLERRVSAIKLPSELIKQNKKQKDNDTKEKEELLKLSKINSTVIQQGVSIRPKLIGLRRNKKPITEEDIDIEIDTVISNDKLGKRSAFKYFEVVNPPCYTEPIIITIHTPLLTEEIVMKLLSYGRVGASRGQGYGEFTAIKV